MRWIKVIQHHVNHDTSDRNIQPYRQGEASNPLVSLKVPAHRPPDGDDYQRNDHRCQEGVRVKNREIYRARHSLPGESRDAMMRVIGQIRNEKQGRSCQRGQLTVAMSINVLPPDEKVSA